MVGRMTVNAHRKKHVTYLLSDKPQTTSANFRCYPLPQISGWQNDCKNKQESSTSFTCDLTNLRQSLPILAAPLPQINRGQKDSKRKQEKGTSLTYKLTNLRKSLPILAAPLPKINGGQNDSIKRNQEKGTSLTYDLTNLR